MPRWGVNKARINKLFEKEAADREQSAAVAGRAMMMLDHSKGFLKQIKVDPYDDVFDDDEFLVAYATAEATLANGYLLVEILNELNKKT